MSSTDSKFNFTNVLGYVGMITVVGSFLITPGTEGFLIANLIGAIITAVYSVIIKSKPVLLMNIFIAIFDVMHLSGIHIDQLLTNF